MLKFLPLRLAVALTVFYFLVPHSQEMPLPAHTPEPSDYLWAQRAFPFGMVPSESYYEALNMVKNTPQNRENTLNWTLAGPTKVSGRITDVAMHSSDTLTVYAASASGGVWKSEDAGQNWFPITDQLPSLSIGDIALDPSDKNTLYVGTGEPNGGGGSVTYDGRGLFKSTDAGLTWSAIGLEKVGSVGRIEVDPERPNRIFVAAMGHLFANGPDRGIYRSTDGGSTWEQSLFVNDSTGGIDLAIHPLNPDTVFAVSWQRVRRPNRRQYGGPGCKIWRSTNGGEDWTALTTGLPSNNLGRIGIAISASNPSVLYAIYADETGNFKGIYKSTNSGNNWALLSGGNPGYPGFGWWFGQIRVHPNDPDEVFTLGLDWAKTTDGGNFWGAVSPYLHADYHALYIHPQKPDLQIVGNDGGIYISEDAGATWGHRPFPITQFYTSEIDFQNPERLYGGSQDNGTWRTLTGNVDDWSFIYGGDGFVTLVNPQDPSIYYAESQYGGFSGSNGASAPNSSRYNWNTPYIFDPINPDIMYIGAEKVFKSVNGGINWTSISPDLTNGSTGQNGVRYGSITTLSASSFNTAVLWAGTDDGNVWITQNGGISWTKVSIDLPKRWVTRVVADPETELGAWVSLSGFRHFDDMAHIYRTFDGGVTWIPTGGNLPDLPVNDLVLDPDEPNTRAYIATDAGVFITFNGGDTWEPANIGLPTVPVTDLTVHGPTRSLVAATFGRAMYRSDLPVLSGIKTAQVFDNVMITPNPFFSKTKVWMNISTTKRVNIRLFDSSGRCVQAIFNGTLPAGEHSFGVEGSALASGVYLLQISDDNGSMICKKLLRS